MPIHAMKAPPGGAEVIASAIIPLFDPEDGPESPIVAEVARDGDRTVEVAAPHPVYVATLEDITSGHPLRSARPDGWRYLLLLEGKAVASANVDVDEETGKPEFSHASTGPYVDSTVEAIRRAEYFPEVKKKKFDLCLLDVPALALRALWLHAHGADDILVPLDPTPPQVERYRKYSEAELVGAVSDAARKQLDRQGDEPI